MVITRKQPGILWEDIGDQGPTVSFSGLLVLVVGLVSRRKGVTKFLERLRQGASWEGKTKLLETTPLLKSKIVQSHRLRLACSRSP
jgi:hypothetical protein